MATTSRKSSLLDPSILRAAALASLAKLDPRLVAKNPVMFVVEVGSLLTTLLWLRDRIVHPPGAAPGWFTLTVSLWLWFTVIFANFAEAVAEGRGKAQADTLRKMRRDVEARRLGNGKEEQVPAASLRKGDVVVVEAGQMIPGDGEVIEGVASVNESAITGESAPVIRESGGDRSAVTGGTTVLSDRILVRITANPGESFLDRMIGLVEGASRQKTPNEIALHILLVGLTLDLPLRLRHPGSHRGLLGHPALGDRRGRAARLPHPHHHRRPALGHRHRRHGPAAAQERAGHERAGGGGGRRRGRAAPRQDRDHHPRATAWRPTSSRPRASAWRTWPTRRSWPAWPTRRPEGRSIVVLAKERFALRGRDLEGQAHFVPFTAQTRMSGCDLGDRIIRKGAVDAVARHVATLGGAMPEDLIGRGRPDRRLRGHSARGLRRRRASSASSS